MSWPCLKFRDKARQYQNQSWYLSCYPTCIGHCVLKDYTFLVCRTCNHRAHRDHLESGRCLTAFTPSKMESSRSTIGTHLRVQLYSCSRIGTFYDSPWRADCVPAISSFASVFAGRTALVKCEERGERRRSNVPWNKTVLMVRANSGCNGPDKSSTCFAEEFRDALLGRATVALPVSLTSLTNYSVAGCVVCDVLASVEGKDPRWESDFCITRGWTSV